MKAVKLDVELNEALIYIRNLDHCPPSYLNDPSRKEFFEIVWLKNEDALHAMKGADIPVKGDWIYLIPPYRVHQLNKAGKKGILLSFKRDILDEDAKEFMLDIFRIFNIQGEFSCLQLDEQMASDLDKVFNLLEEEYLRNNQSVVMLSALLKVFLLQLVRFKEQEFTIQDINQKRVYEFMVLLEMNYETVRNTDFYAGRLGISSKRLNQILKEKLDKTGMQLIHDRLILEAKRQIIHSARTIKEIAYELGFTDRPYFSRFFKQHTGLTPEQFQKEVQQHITTKSNTLI
jgi:AraC family transcriptional activator of pobA